MEIIEKPKSLVRYPVTSYIILVILQILNNQYDYGTYTWILSCYIWILFISIFEREAIIEGYEKCYSDVRKIHKNIKLFME